MRSLEPHSATTRANIARHTSFGARARRAGVTIPRFPGAGGSHKHKGSHEAAPTSQVAKSQTQGGRMGPRRAARRLLPGAGAVAADAVGNAACAPTHMNACPESKVEKPLPGMHTPSDSCPSARQPPPGADGTAYGTTPSAYTVPSTKKEIVEAPTRLPTTIPTRRHAPSAAGVSVVLLIKKLFNSRCRAPDGTVTPNTKASGCTVTRAHTQHRTVCTPPSQTAHNGTLQHAGATGCAGKARAASTRSGFSSRAQCERTDAHSVGTGTLQTLRTHATVEAPTVAAVPYETIAILLLPL
jgi:hypothetical protein